MWKVSLTLLLSFQNIVGQSLHSNPSLTVSPAAIFFLTIIRALKIGIVIAMPFLVYLRYSKESYSKV